MFPLNTKSLPAGANDLAAALTDCLRAVFDVTSDPVTVQDLAYPHLASLKVALDGAKLRAHPPGPPSVSGESTPALTVDSFAAAGAGMSVGPATIDFSLNARGVVLNQAPDRNGNIVLLLHKAADGRVEIFSSPGDLEALIAEVARTEAGKHGVSIDNVRLSLRSQGSRSLAAEIHLRAKKLFMSASLRLTGRVDLDEGLNARISGLDCAGEGAIASMACGVLKPHLQKLNGREFPLMSLPLGEVRLRDVRIAVGDKLSVTAEFGSTV